MTKLNISQAAKTFGKDRKTIQSHIKQGRLSCEVDSNAHKLIDLAELIRVYGEPKKNSSLSSARKDEEIFRHSPLNSPPIFEEKIELLKEQIETLREDKKDLKQQLREEKENHWKEKEKLLGIVEKQTLMITDIRKQEPIQKTSESTPEHQPKKQRLLFGGLIAAIVILLIALALTLPRVDKIYSLGLFSPDFHAWVELLVGKLF